MRPTRISTLLTITALYWAGTLTLIALIAWQHGTCASGDQTCSDEKQVLVYWLLAAATLIFAGLAAHFLRRR
jgi:hypothetical protein